MKKIIASTLLIIICFTTILSLSGCSDSFKIIFCGKNIVGDVLPIVQDDEVFYPLNDFCDVIDAEYKYSAYEDKITLRNQETKIEIFSEKDIISIDDIRDKLEKRPIMQDGMIFIPLKAVASAFKYNVELKFNKLVITETLDLITKKTDQNHTIYYEYDADGNLLSETSDDDYYTYTYNDEGKLLTVTDGDNEIVECYEYNEKGRVVEHKKDSYIYKFDDKGNTIYRDYREDSDGTILKMRYDNYNNVIHHQILSPESNEEYICTYTYDDEGRLISEVSSTGSITYTYDKHTIIKEHVFTNGTKQATIQDYNGKMLFVSTDTINTIEEIKQTENTVEFITNMGKRKYMFNDLNLIIDEEWDGSFSYKKIYTYDEYGNLLEIKDGDGKTIESYTYNELGNLTEYSQYDRIIKKYEYNDNGKITYFENVNGNSIRYEYDETNNLIYKEVESNGDFVEKYISRGGVSTPISYRRGTTVCEYMTVKR